MNHHKIRRRPRRLALWSAVPGIMALAVAAKLLSVGMLGDTAVESFSGGQHHEVARAAWWLGVANVVEPHKAPFASGDAHVLAGDFPAARQDFEEALRAGAGDDDCKVRVNLVLSIEKLGDAAGEKAESATLFREALAVAGAAPEKCRGSGPANADGEDASLDAASGRLTAKISEGEAQSGNAQQPPTGNQAAPPDGKIKQLEESAKQAQQERAEGQERGEYLRGPDSGPGVDRPW